MCGFSSVVSPEVSQIGDKEQEGSSFLLNPLPKGGWPYTLVTVQGGEA